MTDRLDASDLAGRVALVTGAGGGIGAASARALAQRGASVVLVGRDRSRLDSTADHVRAAGGAAQVVVADVTDGEAVRSVVARTVGDLGRLDVVFANAGDTGPLHPLADYPEDAFDQVISLNLRAVFLAMKHTLPVMAGQGSGSIIVPASLASERGLPGTAAYNAAKHGLLGLVRTAAVEYAPAGVRTNAVVVGFADTPLLRRLAGLVAGNAPGGVEAGLDVMRQAAPVGRIATPQEVAEVVAFLASDAASFVNGATWTVDGGVLTGLGGLG